MKKRPVALFVTPVLPLPGGSGRSLRAWDWLQSLSQEYSVHLLIPGNRDAWPELPSDYPAQALWPLADSVATTRRYHRLSGLLLPLLAALSPRFVSDWQRWSSPSVLDALAARLAGDTVGRIVVFRLYLQDLGATLAAQFPAAQCDLDLDDLESHTRQSVALASWRMGRYGDALRGLSIALQYRLVERDIAHCFQRLYLAASGDVRRLPARLGLSICWRPNRIALPVALAPLPQDGELGLLFVGTLNYPPNEEAVRYLLQHLVPLLRTKLLTPWRLRIVGRHASAALHSMLCSEPLVDFAADVDDLGDSYARTHIVLVPLFAGGGTKLKTLEGFAHRRPVISTGEGVRGLEVIEGVHYLRAHSAEEFAESVIALATRRDLAERVASAGWTLCRQKYARP